MSRKERPPVRFDTAGGRSFALAGEEEVLVARRISEVPGLLRRVEAASAAGLHVAGFVSYEAAPAFDDALRVRRPDARLPLARFTLFRERIAAPRLPPPAEDPAPEWRPSIGEAEYLEAVGRIRELIAAGDSYQVNLTFPLIAPFAGDPLALYARLLRSQRAGYGAYLDLGSHAVLSISPELFFHRRGDGLELRPMKGTRPRGRWTEEDDALAAELTASEKDRAENLMIVDLLRNDAGRVAVPGSVQVPRLFDVERYPTVHQMTSTVTAQIRPNIGLADLFGALFPCGSVTGAPKVRTMEIIREMEPSPRGIYTGAVGYVSVSEAVFNVPIRTLVVDRGRGRVEMGVGSGITFDSDPSAEFAECLAKAAFVHHRPRDFELLETMRREPDGCVFLLERHLARMAGSARYFGFPFDEERVRRAVKGAVAGASGEAKLRLRLAPTGRVTVEAAPLPAEADGPLRVAISRTPVDPADPALYHKTTDRALYEAARAEHPGCDDVLLVNTRGELTESTRANLVVRIDGALVTPPLESGLLPGALRGDLLDRGSIRERVLRQEDLRLAGEHFLASALRGWLPFELV